MVGRYGHLIQWWWLEVEPSEVSESLKCPQKVILTRDCGKAWDRPSLSLCFQGHCVTAGSFHHWQPWVLSEAKPIEPAWPWTLTLRPSWVACLGYFMVVIKNWQILGRSEFRNNNNSSISHSDSALWLVKYLYLHDLMARVPCSNLESALLLYCQSKIKLRRASALPSLHT